MIDYYFSDLKLFHHFMKFKESREGMAKSKKRVMKKKKNKEKDIMVTKIFTLIISK